MAGAALSGWLACVAAKLAAGHAHTACCVVVACAALEGQGLSAAAGGGIGDMHVDDMLKIRLVQRPARHISEEICRAVPGAGTWL